MVTFEKNKIVNCLHTFFVYAKINNKMPFRLGALYLENSIKTLYQDNTLYQKLILCKQLLGVANFGSITEKHPRLWLVLRIPWSRNKFYWYRVLSIWFIIHFFRLIQLSVYTKVAVGFYKIIGLYFFCL